MADVAECITKLVAAGQISKAIGDEAMEFFRRSRAEYSADLGPASADAAAALEAARKLRERAADRQIAIAAGVKTWREIERRVIDDPRGGDAAVVGLLSKDTLRGDSKLDKLRRDQPTHPIFQGASADSLRDQLRRDMHEMLGVEMEKLDPRKAGRQQAFLNAQKFIRENKGVSTGDPAAKALSDSFRKMVKWAGDRARSGGKTFVENENWDNPQPWSSLQVGKFSEQQFVDRFNKWISQGALKVWNKAEGRPAAAGEIDGLLRKAYADIKYEGGEATPFSKEMRTFEFEHSAAGADAFLDLQSVFGVGNELPSIITRHIDRMASDIALREVLGPNPDAAFAAALRLAAEKNPGTSVPSGAKWLTSARTARLTYGVVSGKGHPVANENAARFMAGARSLLGAAALRNLPITIAPGDSAMTLLSLHHDGISGVKAFRYMFDGMNKDVARDLQISAHSYIDYNLNTWRRYSDQINYSGLAQRVPQTVIRATGARLWSDNLRMGVQRAYFGTLARMRDLPFDKLPQNLREHFLGQFGVTPADWDKIRSVAPMDQGNGAPILDLPKLTELDRPLSERLQMAVSERSSYAAHQPDARTQGIAGQGVARGSLGGEMWLMVPQYKQFVLERMTTHLFRILRDGTMPEKLRYGFAFAALSMMAGAVSMQTKAVIGGKDPLDMHSVKFWIDAFAQGGAGGIYGDLLSDALRGDIGAAGGVAGGALGGLGTDVFKAATSPLRNKYGERRTSSGEIFNVGRRWTPNTWFTKLAVDRLFWDRMQVLLDPNYRQSFRRAEQNAKKQGSGFWWAPGQSTPGTQ